MRHQLAGWLHEDARQTSPFGHPLPHIVLPDATVVRHWPTVKKAAAPPQEVLEVLKTR